MVARPVAATITTVQQPPGYPPQYAAARPTNTLAMVSLVAGIASFVIVPILGALVAIITGHMARGQIRRTGEDGSAAALAGLILGYIHLALVAIALVVLIVVGIAFAALFHQQQP